MTKMDNATRKYPFSWALLGDIAMGRPNLGVFTHLSVYRLMQFTFRDIIEQKYGAQAVEEVFYEAGKLAGTEFYRNIIGQPGSLNEFITHTQAALRDLNIGILRVEKSDPDKNHYILTVSEDLDCSGLPEIGHEVCTYDEGFIAALFEEYLGKPFQVKEIDCWCTGDRTCRFDARMAE